MAGWDGKSKGSRLGYAIFIFFIRHFGLKSAYALLRPVILYYYCFKPSVRRPLMHFYTARLGYPAARSRTLIRQNLYLFGQTLIDKVVALNGEGSRFEVQRTGGHYLDELAAGGKGGILVSAHLGNWELAGHLLQRLETPVNIVMYDGEAEAVKHYLDHVTGPKAFNIIYLRKDLSHIYEMAAALRRNELICIHADRFVEGNRTFSADFLGSPALFPQGPFVLASKLRAPVCFVFALKSAPLQYHFFGNPPKTYEGRGDTGARQMLQDFVALLEKMVREHPEQWFNYFDFWKKDASHPTTSPDPEIN